MAGLAAALQFAARFAQPQMVVALVVYVAATLALLCAGPVTGSAGLGGITQTKQFLGTPPAPRRRGANAKVAAATRHCEMARTRLQTDIAH